MANKIKIGKIEVEVSQNPSAYIPSGSKDFIDHGEILKTIALGIRDNLPVLLIGESGGGKSSAVRYLAEKTNNGLRRINLNGGTTADELVGRQLLNEKGTIWTDGILTDAMRKGEWVVLDAINAAGQKLICYLALVIPVIHMSVEGGWCSMSYPGGGDKPGGEATILCHLQNGGQVLSIPLSLDGAGILADNTIVRLFSSCHSRRCRSGIGYQ